MEVVNTKDVEVVLHYILLCYLINREKHNGNVLPKMIKNQNYTSSSSSLSLWSSLTVFTLVPYRIFIARNVYVR
jgi:hypothetical protein